MNRHHPSAQTYRLAAKWRWMASIPLAVIVFAGGASAVAFSGSDVWWWIFPIFALPTVLAVVITLEMSRLRLEFDAHGLRYYTAGYMAQSPWPEVSRSQSGTALILSNPRITYSPWMGWMIPIVAATQPRRAGLATHAMRSIPLGYFDDGTLDAALVKALSGPPSAD